MDEAQRQALGESGKRYLERFDRFDDRATGNAWVAIARRQPTVHVSTKTGLWLVVRRKVVGVGKVSYEAFVGRLRKSRVAWMHCMAPHAGRVQVTNANVYEVRGRDFRRQGIGTAIYDLIEADVRAAGGEGLEPHWGAMSDEAIAFWQKRRPDQAHKIAELNQLGAQAGSWLFD